jgi:hypothetical protein
VDVAAVAVTPALGSLVQDEPYEVGVAPGSWHVKVRLWDLEVL